MSKYRPNFEKMFRNEEKYGLPRRWDGKDFCQTIYAFFKAYKEDIAQYFPDMLNDITTITQNIYTAVLRSFQGLPIDAYSRIEQAMHILRKSPLLIADNEYDSLKLYRVADAGDTAQPDRSRVFHVPFNLRTKMSTQRFSIPGFPCLYLGSNLELCCEEIGKDRTCPSLIAAQFEMESSINTLNVLDNNQIIIFDICIYPERLFSENGIICAIKEETYVKWYPLIAACSFIRAKKADPYAPEYVIPQLFMQWIHREYPESFVGVRYFSCASVRASRKGENYAFPTIGTPISTSRNTPKNYDEHLARRFKISTPCFLNEYSTYQECEDRFANSEKKILDETATIINNTISEGETEIAYAAFANSSIPTITLPDSLISIGSHAFRECKKLKSITIPGSVKHISESAFEGCTNLLSIDILDGVTNIYKRAFYDCRSLNSITIPGSVKYISESAFEGCTNLPDDVKQKILRINPDAII